MTVEPSHLISVLIPFLASLVFCFQSYKRTKPIKGFFWATFFVFVIGCFANIELAFWSDRGLHVVPMASVFLIVWILYHRQTLLWVYPGTFFSVLVTDLVVAQGKPGYPWGIRGAGILDSLYLMPIVFLFLGLLAKKHYKSTHSIRNTSYV